MPSTTTTNNALSSNFFIQFAQRFMSSTPKFFKLIQLVAIVVAGISTILADVVQGGFTLPTWLSWLQSNITVVSGWLTALLTQLPTTVGSSTRSLQSSSTTVTSTIKS